MQSDFHSTAPQHVRWPIAIVFVVRPQTRFTSPPPFTLPQLHQLCRHRIAATNQKTTNDIISSWTITASDVGWAIIISHIRWPNKGCVDDKLNIIINLGTIYMYYNTICQHLKITLQNYMVIKWLWLENIYIVFRIVAKHMCMLWDDRIALPFLKFRFGFDLRSFDRKKAQIISYRRQIPILAFYYEYF